MLSSEKWNPSKNSENKKEKKKEKNLLTKKSKDSNRYNTNFTARKQNDNKWSHKSFESDQEKVRNTKTFKKDIITISDSMIKYVNDREILRFSLATISKDFIDYVRSIAWKNSQKWWVFTLVPITLQIKSTPRRKLEKQQVCS